MFWILPIAQDKCYNIKEQKVILYRFFIRSISNQKFPMIFTANFKTKILYFTRFLVIVIFCSEQSLWIFLLFSNVANFNFFNLICLHWFEINNSFKKPPIYLSNRQCIEEFSNNYNLIYYVLPLPPLALAIFICFCFHLQKEITVWWEFNEKNLWTKFINFFFIVNFAKANEMIFYTVVYKSFTSGIIDLQLKTCTHWKELHYDVSLGAFHREECFDRYRVSF